MRYKNPDDRQSPVINKQKHTMATAATSTSMILCFILAFHSAILLATANRKLLETHPPTISPTPQPSLESPSTTSPKAYMPPPRVSNGVKLPFHHVVMPPMHSIPYHYSHGSVAMPPIVIPHFKPYRYDYQPTKMPSVPLVSCTKLPGD